MTNKMRVDRRLSDGPRPGGKRTRDDATDLDSLGLDNLRPDLPGAGTRQDPRAADRQGGDRPGRGGGHARLRRDLDARRGQGGRLRNDRPSVRHDGDGRLPSHGGVLRTRDGADRRPVFRTACVARGDDHALGRPLGVPGQRRRLRRADAPGASTLPAVESGRRSLSRRPGDGLDVGSVATITGNPQNIIIGSLSQISYLRFAARLAPVAAIGLLLDFDVVAWSTASALGGDGEVEPCGRRAASPGSIAVS